MNACNILFTSVGRRVSLIRHFSRALKELNIAGRIIGADATSRSPAFYITDKSYVVPRISTPDYVPSLLNICEREQIKIVIPLIDTELYLLSTIRNRFAEFGVQILISDPETINIAMFKTESCRFFKAHDIDTPELLDDEDIKRKHYKFPLIVKPNDGSASKMVFRVDDEEQLKFFTGYVPNKIVQEFIAGEEYTLDVFVDMNGTVRCVVPRLRIEVRAGEVSKSLIVKNSALIARGKRVCECLPGARGCITLQCIVDNNDSIKVVEINPRFGGGAPLSIEAGADFPKWIIQMVTAQEIGDVYDSYKDGLMMLRFDDAIFVDQQKDAWKQSREI